MIIRPYTKWDRTSCIGLFNSNVPQFFDETEFPGFKYMLDGLDVGKKAFEDSEAEYYFVAEREGRIVACGGFCVRSENKTAGMTWGMVDKALHRQGIGLALLEFRIRTIEEMYPDYQVILDTTQHSFGFFEKLGFRTIKITKDSYAPGMDRYDMVR